MAHFLRCDDGAVMSAEEIRWELRERLSEVTEAIRILHTLLETNRSDDREELFGELDSQLDELWSNMRGFVSYVEDQCDGPDDEDFKGQPVHFVKRVAREVEKMTDEESTELLKQKIQSGALDPELREWARLYFCENDKTAAAAEARRIIEQAKKI